MCGWVGVCLRARARVCVCVCVCRSNVGAERCAEAAHASCPRQLARGPPSLRHDDIPLGCPMGTVSCKLISPHTLQTYSLKSNALMMFRISLGDASVLFGLG
jgi:hypothetical protein